MPVRFGWAPDTAPLPYKRAAVWGVAAFLVVLAIGVMAFPHDVPGLTVPDSPDAMKAMDSMQMAP